MKVRSSALVGCMTIALTLAMDSKIDCKDVATAGLLDGIWFALATSNAQQGPPGPQGPQGEPGESGLDAPGTPGAAGADGISCWDLNGNGFAEPDEDINGDGNFNGLDCQGSDGADGADGVSAEGG